MQVICSWCEKFVREKEPLENKSISHSICEECLKKVIGEIKKFKEKNKNIKSTSNSKKEMKKYQRFA